MPLVRLPASKAVETRKTNQFAGWGDRAMANRVEPIAKPTFDVPFKFARGSKIFTVGSCFARNVEEELLRRGFQLPMREVILEEALPSVLNNYATPSIYNEFAWAFEAEPFVDEHHLIEMMPGKFADLHLSPTLRPEPLERVKNRRRAITAAYRQAAECPVLIMTLGLVEAWFDTKSGFYVNAAPRPGHLRSEPDRFEMHVLSFEECYDYLERTILLLRKHGRPDLQVILTVSPVPLTFTHRNVDVLVANTYSKSVLRAAAETLVNKYDCVTYYPSYESVILSDRQRAFREDFVHVTHELVALNVGRMVDAYIEDDEDLASIRAQIESGGAAQATEKAKSIRGGSREKASVFFQEFGHLSAQHSDFALEHAQFLAEIGDFEGVVKTIDGAPADMPEITAALIKANALVKLGRAREAVALLESFAVRTDGPSAKKIRAATFWFAMLNAAVATNDENIIVGALAKQMKGNPALTPRANAQVGRWFQDKGELDRAIGFFRTSVAAGNEGNQAHLYLAEALTALGKHDEAQAALAKLQVRGKGMEFHAQRLAGSAE